MFPKRIFVEEGGGFGPDFTKEFFDSTHLNKGSKIEITLDKSQNGCFQVFLTKTFRGMLQT